MNLFRIAVAGCGGMSHTWIRYALERPDAEIVALVDLNPEQAARTAQTFGLSCPTFTDLTEAIRSTDANLVFDVTVPQAHHAVVTAAVRNGCDVFGEKPMAATFEQARDLLRLTRETGRTFNVMQNRRYNPNIRALRELVLSGRIGDVGLVAADFFIGAHFGGFRDLMDSPLIVDMAIHTFDQARFITGANPVSVYCHEFNPPGSWYKGNASAVCIFEMSDGSVFNYRESWCAEGAQTSWESAWRVVGSIGTAIWDDHGAPYAEVVIPGQEQPKFRLNYERFDAVVSWNGRQGHYGYLDEMFAALREGRPAETNCADNIYSIAMVFSAVESARTGRKVPIEVYP